MEKRIFKLLMLVLVGNGASLPLPARDLGKHGHVVEIAEENIIEFLNTKSNLLPKDQKEALFKKMQQEAVYRARNPKPQHLPEAKAKRIFTYDPTIVLNQDIFDHEGKIIAKKGERYNPLTAVTLIEPLCFFDGSKKEHLLWAESQKGKWVLTAGSPYEIEEQKNIPVYFDQGGELVNKLGINAIPALVTQNGSLLQIEEISL